MAVQPKRQKLYCYVDETGQDTRGALFLVAVVITAAERDALRQSARLSQGKFYYALYRNTVDYLGLTIQTCALAIARHTQHPYKATVVVDGLRRSEQHTFAVQLRRYGVHTQKVRGATEQSDIFVRLADALCGFLRGALTGNEESQLLMGSAEAKGYLVKLGGQ